MERKFETAYGEFTPRLEAYGDADIKNLGFWYESKIKEVCDKVQGCNEVTLYHYEPVTINGKTYKGIIITVYIMYTGEWNIRFKAASYGEFLTDAAKEKLEKALSAPALIWVQTHLEAMRKECLADYQNRLIKNANEAIQTATMIIDIAKKIQ